MKLGSLIDTRGPLGKFTYLGNGLCQFFDVEKKIYIERKFKRIGMLGAGTGITPLYQLLQAANRNKDSIEFTLFYGNSTEKDILLKEELEEFAKANNFKFKLILMINENENNWKGEVGHFNFENISKYMYEPSDDTLILHCGRKALCNDVYEQNLLKLGHKKENIFRF